MWTMIFRSFATTFPLVTVFFQAERGIRDYKVTGVQTCALPILPDPQVASAAPGLTIPRLSRPPALGDFFSMTPQGDVALQMAKVTGFAQRNPHDGEPVSEPKIGRAHV